MFKRPQWVAFGAVALVGLVLLNLPDQLAARLKIALGALFLPLFGLVGSAQHLAAETARTFTPRAELGRQLEALRRENQRLQLELARAREALEENQRLRQLLGWTRASPWKTRVCTVLARDPEAWWRALHIDAGARDGLRPGLPVVTPEGLVGRVDRVAHATAEVVLVGDPRCRVAVVVRETGETGVLTTHSAGVLDHRLVDLTHLPRNFAVRPGQSVFTSGLGGVFPPGLPVGTVVDTRSVGYGLYAEARVKLHADPARLREVIVLLP
jgi:rod shape-determining protein MreC